MIRTVDYAPLTDSVTPAEVAAFRTQSRTNPAYSSASPIIQVIVAVVFLLIFGGVILTFVGIAATFASEVVSSGSPVAIGAVAFPVIVLGFMLFVVVLIVRSAISRGSRWERWLRLERFAQANGLIFSPEDKDPQYPGMIFSRGHHRAAIEHLRSASDRFLDYGTYRYKTGSGKNESTHTWGFLALQLDRALPNMVLDSKADNGMFGGSNLPVTFTKNQVLSLEGDFDKYFTLYCPKEYERDALYVFTPDLMALLIDTASPFDVEIVDTWMFVYSRTAFDLRQPAVNQRLLRIVDAVGAKTIAQTDRYRDERVGDFTANLVAPQGQRLKRGVSVGAIVIFVVFAAIWGLPFVLGLVGLGT